MNINNFLPIFYFSNDIKLFNIFNLNFFSITHDWFGKTVNNSPSFLLGYNEINIYFAFSNNHKPFFNKKHKINTYNEGLWEYDVAEFFIFDIKAKKYQEFNLSPTGSWWTMLFCDYRKQDQNNLTIPDRIEIYSDYSEKMWQVALKLPLNQLSVDFFDPGNCTGNVCAIVNKNRKYLSWAKSCSQKPDFHLVKSFLPFEMIPFRSKDNL